MGTTGTRTRKRRSDAGKPRQTIDRPPRKPAKAAPGDAAEANAVLPEEAAAGAQVPPVTIGAEQSEPVSVSEASGIRRTSKKKQQEQAEQAAAVLLTILDGAVGVAFGEEARMLPYEQAMMVDPMGRILGRMEPGTAELIEKWSDPIILLFGFATWGARVWSIASDRGDSGKKPPPEVVPPPRGNGQVRDEVPAASPPADLLSRVGAERAEVRSAKG
jgi:hypothetical protein